MKKLLILGAGTAGTMVANRLRRCSTTTTGRSPSSIRARRTTTSRAFLFIPFGIYGKKDVVKPKRDFIPPGVELIMSAIDVIEPEQNRVKLADGRKLTYDFLVIATGADIHPEQTPAWPSTNGASRSTTSTPSKARWRWPSNSRPGPAAAWWSTSWITRSSARLRRWSS